MHVRRLSRLPAPGKWNKESFLQQFADGRSNQSELALRLSRMVSMRFILSNDQFTIVKDDYPDTKKWMISESDAKSFQLSNPDEPSGSQRVHIEIRDDSHIRFTMVSTGHESSIPLVKVSAVDTWQAPAKFEIAMPAPLVKVEKWISEPAVPIVFGDGNVYVIEFWAKVVCAMPRENAPTRELAKRNR